MDDKFADFLRRIRSGDEQAATELVRHYEPLIRREVRMRLTDPCLYRLVDSVDICQSVMVSFFVRAAAGQYELDSQEDLLKLLVTMARNKLASQVRKVQSRPADKQRSEASQQELEMVLNGPDPGRIFLGKELLEKVLQRLNDDERRVAELRGEGLTWPAIAASLGGTSEARRKQLARALDRVSRELGLDMDNLHDSEDS